MDFPPSNQESAVDIDEVDACQAEGSHVEEYKEASLVNDLLKGRDWIIGPTIVRVPAKLRQNKLEALIEPSVVSIGPYHRMHERVAPMENKKLLVLQMYQSSPQCNLKVDACKEMIKRLQLRARQCYREGVHMGDDSFVNMLMLDGLFIIAFCSASHTWFDSLIGWDRATIATDLILLENQIPFFVIHSIWDHTMLHPLQHADLKNIAAQLCDDQISKRVTTPLENIDHLLDICHHYFVPDMSEHQPVLPPGSCLGLCTLFGCHSFLSCTRNGCQGTSGSRIPCAAELEEAGLEFRKKKSRCEIMDVTFRGGSLEIPYIEISDSMMHLFMNLIAFEQTARPNKNRENYSQSADVNRYLTSYILFMGSIIKTRHDVEILQRQGIIENLHSGEKEVALFFIQLGHGVDIFQDHYLDNLFREVNQYYDSRCFKYRAKLMRNYFNSPWSIISLLAGIVLLSLTFAQTYFAGYSYFHPSSN